MSHVDSGDYESYANKVSPGFTADIVFHGVAQRLPLRAITQLAPAGSLGVLLGYSDHDGLDALRWITDFTLGDDADPRIMISDGTIDTCLWQVMTIPIRERELVPGVVAVHPTKGSTEAEAMVRAGLARWRPDLPSEPAGMHASGARMLELLGVAAWRKFDPDADD
jgi:hypothetical protein